MRAYDENVHRLVLEGLFSHITDADEREDAETAFLEKHRHGLRLSIAAMREGPVTEQGAATEILDVLRPLLDLESTAAKRGSISAGQRMLGDERERKGET